jgi:hypothetical protein
MPSRLDVNSHTAWFVSKKIRPNTFNLIISTPQLAPTCPPLPWRRSTRAQTTAKPSQHHTRRSPSIATIHIQISYSHPWLWIWTFPRIQIACEPALNELNAGWTRSMVSSQFESNFVKVLWEKNFWRNIWICLNPGWMNWMRVGVDRDFQRWRVNVKSGKSMMALKTVLYERRQRLNAVNSENAWKRAFTPVNPFQ